MRWGIPPERELREDGKTYLPPPALLAAASSGFLKSASSTEGLTVISVTTADCCSSPFIEVCDLYGRTRFAAGRKSEYSATTSAGPVGPVPRYVCRTMRPLAGST